jgi:light-regulated signal transduction histidine kinase (bacteriophytochrome)
LKKGGQGGFASSVVKSPSIPLFQRGKTNADLAARTAELESSNRELAAFNYMASHDLCQPLNNIHTSAQAIELLCMDKIDEDCKKLLQIVKKAAMNMRNLIATFLRFSQSEHAELHLKMADLSEMARVVTADLRVADSGRRVTFNIEEGVKVYCDPELLRVVLENIIGNAWKYTANREQATIEFGAMEADGRKTFFVRDNGVGFDTRDVEKLFHPFKRLQGSDELTGHGIGLATVERIIRRHGGKIWAQGEPGKGATFFFTLCE